MQLFLGGLFTLFKRLLSHNTFTYSCEDLEETLQAEVVGSVDTSVSLFLEVKITSILTQLEKWSTNYVA